MVKPSRQSHGWLHRAFGISILVWTVRSLASRDVSRNLADIHQSCVATEVLTHSNGSRDGFTSDVLALLSAVEHTFILTKNDCVRSVPMQLAGRVTCVKGSALDACAPAKYIWATRTSMRHALRVTFAHAYILYIAHQEKYESVAVLEADAVFLNRDLSHEAVNQVHRLLKSRDWNVLRVGFRPYFLEQNAVDHCPRRCRCNLQHDYGKNLCSVRGNGCDLRSSDFYIIRRDGYKLLYQRLLHLHGRNLNRVIDTKPLQSMRKQWLLIPQLSFQSTLDIPLDYQVGQSALYLKKCVGPRPLPRELLKPLQFVVTEDAAS